MNDRDAFKKFHNNKLLFDSTYFEWIEDISDSYDDIFLPIDIVEIIRPIMVQSISRPDDADNEDYLIIKFPWIKREDSFAGILNYKEVTLKDFLDVRYDALAECNERLRKNSDSKIPLNLIDRS